MLRKISTVNSRVRSPIGPFVWSYRIRSKSSTRSTYCASGNAGLTIHGITPGRLGRAPASQPGLTMPTGRSRGISYTCRVMATISDEFLASITSARRAGTTTARHGARSIIPCDHFDSTTVAQLYRGIDQWDTWRVTLVSRVHRQLAEPEQLVRYVEDRFSAVRFLVFYMRMQDTGQVVPIDLTHRDHFLDSSGCGAMRQLLVFGRPEPTWKTVRENVGRDLGAFEQLVRQLHGAGDLTFVGEPRSPSLREALVRLARFAYLDNAAIGACATTAEAHFRSGHLKSCAAMLRPAVEQVIKDAYQEAVRRQLVAPAALPDLRSQTDSICRGNPPFVDKSVGQFAYGTFSLLSGLGSHTGQVDDITGAQAWHAAVAALLMLGMRLPQ